MKHEGSLLVAMNRQEVTSATSMTSARSAAQRDKTLRSLLNSRPALGMPHHPPPPPPHHHHPHHHHMLPVFDSLAARLSSPPPGAHPGPPMFGPMSPPPGPNNGSLYPGPPFLPPPPSHLEMTSSAMTFMPPGDHHVIGPRLHVIAGGNEANLSPEAAHSLWKGRRSLSDSFASVERNNNDKLVSDCTNGEGGGPGPSSSPYITCGGAHPGGAKATPNITTTSSSGRDVLEWKNIDDVDVPCIARADDSYIPAEMIDRLLLVKYPGPHPDRLKRRPPLKSTYMTLEESRLINRVVTHNVRLAEAIHHKFTLQDLLVCLPEFLTFYHELKMAMTVSQDQTSSQQSPDYSLAAPRSARAAIAQSTRIAKAVAQKSPTELPIVFGGWVQVDNTVVPFVLRNRVKLVPLAVIRYAAGLLDDVHVDGLECLPEECIYLNQNCSTAGLGFSFPERSKLIELFLVPTLCKNKLNIVELPTDNPFSHARTLPARPDRRSVFVAAATYARVRRKSHAGDSSSSSSTADQQDTSGQQQQQQQQQHSPNAESNSVSGDAGQASTTLPPSPPDVTMTVKDEYNAPALSPGCSPPRIDVPSLIPIDCVQPPKLIPYDSSDDNPPLKKVKQEPEDVFL